MARRSLGILMRHFRGLIAKPGEGSDGQLLQRFALQHEEAAFDTLLQRYGPLVHGLCRRLLGDAHDADDAFQATFLVLARKADSVRKHESIGSWLYGVAYRVACDARAKTARRRRHEQRAGDLPAEGPMKPAISDPDPATAAGWRELRGVLDDELQHLPEKYRAPLVLCYLRGLTNEEAARELGWPPGSMSKQLARARELLLARLVRRGVAVSAPVLGTVLAEHTASGAIPAGLQDSTLKIAMLCAAGQAIAPEAVSVAALAEGVLHAMRMTKLKTAAALLVVLGLLGTAAGFGLKSHLPQPSPDGAQLAAEQPKKEKSSATANPAGAAASDPVEQFREALRIPVHDNPNQEEIRFRKALLEKKASEVKRIDDLRRVLALQEWRDQDREALIAAVDGPVRKDLVARFEQSARQALDKGNTEAQLAVVTMVGDMGTAVRGINQNVSLARELGPDLIALLRREPTGAVAEAAARALGKINPEPKSAAQALKKLLASKHDPVRQAAAQGLASLPETTSAIMRSAGPNRVIVTREEAVRTALQALTAAAHGLKDPDPMVRRFCLETIRGTAGLLGDLVGEVPRFDFPPPGRKPSDDEKTEMLDYRKQVEEERAMLLPLAHALAEQTPAVAHAVGDDDWQASVIAAGVLENLAGAREKQLQKAASVPRMEGADDKKLKDDPLGDPLSNAVRTAVKALVRPEVRVRLAAIYFLETLRSDGAAAIPSLVRAAGDADPFVRWGVARALGRMAPRGAAAAVPALARLLPDDNRDVRITAAAALERFGPAARPAVPALIRAAGSKDVATRVWAIQALGAIGAEARSALPVLVDALSAPQAEARVAAARSLGRLGPAARTAAYALRKALNDTDADVREAAAAALLAVK